MDQSALTFDEEVPLNATLLKGLDHRLKIFFLIFLPWIKRLMLLFGGSLIFVCLNASSNRPVSQFLSILRSRTTKICAKLFLHSYKAVKNGYKAVKICEWTDKTILLYRILINGQWKQFAYVDCDYDHKLISSKRTSRKCVCHTICIIGCFKCMQQYQVVGW